MDTPDNLHLLEGIPVRPGTKLAALVVALRRPQGATNLQLMLATGWQPHSVRGAISGLLRKRLGLNVVLTRNAAGERVYRIGRLTVPPQRVGVQFMPRGTRGPRTLTVVRGLWAISWIPAASRPPARTSIGFRPMAMSAVPMCKPQTLQTSVCTRTVAKRRARAPCMAPSPGRTPFASGEAQMSSGSCIHAGMSRWPCSTRQTSTWSERST